MDTKGDVFSVHTTETEDGWTKERQLHTWKSDPLLLAVVNSLDHVVKGGVTCNTHTTGLRSDELTQQQLSSAHCGSKWMICALMFLCGRSSYCSKNKTLMVPKKHFTPRPQLSNKWLKNGWQDHWLIDFVSSGLLVVWKNDSSQKIIKHQFRITSAISARLFVMMSDGLLNQSCGVNENLESSRSSAEGCRWSCSSLSRSCSSTGNTPNWLVSRAALMF